jgi:hypothetical protein
MNGQGFVGRLWKTYGRHDSMFEPSPGVVPRVSRLSVVVGLFNGVHSSGNGHTTVQLDAVHDMAALFPDDDEPLEVLRLGLVQFLFHRRE